ncbi:MAG: hypothetical protein IJ530_11290 [Treponema sp.]|uniref:hypothetical protein n=1 Tax=Treponema sp. TaxID=166 RepID=UPI0025FB63EE|nr:hypothetical protein [Treponema sp.]MBQ8680332.1 hypothetical protein [Treponema sp.]
MRTIAIFQVLKPLTRFLERKMAWLVFFLEKHYTPLAVVALIILGTVFFFVTSYLFRYNHWNYWLWKSRALVKTVYFGTILVAIKLVLEAM